MDEVIERVKRDPELDKHEQRLVGYIVDPRKFVSRISVFAYPLNPLTGTSTSTFRQLHLPLTVYSIRSIASLPLLRPHALRRGILKEYGIAECLLLGPPGIGKPLVVRALAKEAECRMLAVSPPDVVDMASFYISCPATANLTCSVSSSM